MEVEAVTTLPRGSIGSAVVAGTGVVVGVAAVIDAAVAAGAPVVTVGTKVVVVGATEVAVVGATGAVASEVPPQAVTNKTTRTNGRIFCTNHNPIKTDPRRTRKLTLDYLPRSGRVCNRTHNARTKSGRPTLLCGFIVRAAEI